MSDREVVALRLSGMPLQAIVAPALCVGALLSVVAFWLHAGPAAGAEQKLRARQRDLADRFLASLSGPDRTIALQGARISFSRYEGDVFYDVEIDRRDRGTGRLLQKIIGDRVTLRRVGGDLEIRSPLLWVVGESDGSASSVRSVEGEVTLKETGETEKVGPLDTTPAGEGDSPTGTRLELGHVTDIGLATGLNDLIQGGRFELRPKDMTLPDLVYLGQRGEIVDIKARRTSVELQSRLASAATPLLFALLVAAGALQVPPGGRRLLGFLVALTPVFALHFPLTLFGRSLAEAGQIPPAAGVWGASAAALVVALALLRRASLR